MMAGVYDHGSCVEIYGYRLYDSSIDESGANVWTVHSPDGGRPIDVLNLDQFRTTAEIKDYLLEGTER